MSVPDRPVPRPLTVAFAATPDESVRAAVGARAGVRVVEAEAAVGAALAELAAAAEILVTRAWQRVDAGVLEAGRAGALRAVVQGSSGTDNIDTAAAERLDVAVEIVDPGNAVAVAELTLLSLLALARRMPSRWEETAAGRWPDRERVDDRELRGGVLGLVGLGRVGRQVAQRARAFGMEVLAVDPYLADEVFAAHGVERAGSVDALLPRCWAVSLHCPLTAETRGMLGDARLGRLPRGAVVVNTARGGLVDEAALARRLDQGHLAGAAVDVFAEEPARRGSLASHPRVLATPHIGGHTARSHHDRAANLSDALLALVDRLTARPEERGHG
jgi:phosphoglycerate dehydrogenase-like enzyme